MDLTIWSAFGLLGVALYVGAYGALQVGLLRGSSPTYTLLNLGAACAILVSLYEAFNLSSLLIQVFWITFSGIGLARYAWIRSQASFDETERAFLNAHFSTLPPHMARKILSMGQWRTAQEGTVLTRQGAPVRELVYFSDGAAEVRAHGAVVAHVGPGALIGEMTILHGDAATADVELTVSSYLFCIPRDALIRELRADQELAMAVSQALQIEALRKFDAANRRTAGKPPAGNGSPLGDVFEDAAREREEARG